MYVCIGKCTCACAILLWLLVVAKAKAKSECTNFALASDAAFTAVVDFAAFTCLVVRRIVAIVVVVASVFSIYYQLSLSLGMQLQRRDRGSRSF